MIALILLIPVKAGTDTKMTVLVTVQYDNKESVFHKYETYKSHWYSDGQKTLRKRIKFLYDSSKYVTTRVLPDNCYVYYSRLTNNNKRKHAIDQYIKSIELAYGSAKKIELRGHRVIDVGCNDGIYEGQPQVDLASTSELNELPLGFLQKNIKTGAYGCPKDNRNEFELKKRGNGVYILRGDKLKDDKSTINTTRINVNQLNNLSNVKKEDVTSFLHDMTKGLAKVCDFSPKEKTSTYYLVKKNFIKKMENLYENCHEKDPKNEKCKLFLKQKVFASSSIRG